MTSKLSFAVPLQPRAGRRSATTRPPGCGRSSRIYSTALGPALGGTRFYPYARAGRGPRRRAATSRAGWPTRTRSPGSTSAAARPSSSATRRRDKTEALLRAYGRFVQSLGGRYFTACDVGTYIADMDVSPASAATSPAAREAHGGAGDSSVLTAFGVFQGMRAAAEHAWGAPTLRGRTVGVAGVGKVGRPWSAHLLEDGADGRRHRRQRAGGRARSAADAPPGRRSRRTPTRWSPPTSTSTRRARSAARWTTTPSPALQRRRSSAAAANNQLAHPGIEKPLRRPRASSTRPTTWSTPAA